MRMRKISGQTFAAIFIVITVAFSNLLVVPFNSAQAAVDLRRLVFYPVPLATTLAVVANGDTPAILPIRAAGKADKAAVGAVGPLLQSIATTRENEGPYAAALIGQLVGLSQLYQQNEQHEEALEALELAARNSRINSGLYGADQAVLAEHMIASLLALGRYREVEDKYRFLVDVHDQQHGGSVPQKAASLLQLGNWKLQSFHRNLALPDSGQMRAAGMPLGRLGNQAVVNTRFEELYEAQTSFVDAISLLIQDESWTDPNLFALEQQLVRTFYIGANREQVIANPESYGSSRESSREHMRRSAATLELSEQYLNGEAAYRRMIGYLKKDPAATTAAIAEVMLGLADWHLLFGKQAAAEAQLGDLDNFLQKVRASETEVRTILQPELPVTLPAFLDSPISTKPLLDNMHFKGYVDFAFDVRRQGRIAHMEVLGSSEGTDSSITDRLVSLVRQARFRPSLEGTSSFGVRYYYAY